MKFLDKIFKKFKDSAYELKSIKKLSLLGFFMGLFLVLNFFTIEVSSLVCFSFNFIAVFFVGVVFGPFIAAIFGFFGDIFCYFIHPVGVFFIWYAVSVMIDGIIYGLYFYNNKNINNYKKIIFAQILRDMFINVILNSIFIWLQFGGSLIKLLLFVRIPKNIIKIPINCVIMIVCSRAFEKIKGNIKY